MQPIFLVLAVIGFSINEIILGLSFIFLSIFILYLYLTYIFTEYCITDKRLLKKTGFITKC